MFREAVALLDEQADERVTRREPARRTGVSSAAPHRRLSDEQTLLDAIAYEGFQRLQQRLDDALQPCTPSHRDRLLAVWVTHTRFGANHRHHARVMFGPMVKERSAALEVVAKLTFARLVAAVAAARSARGVVDAGAAQIALVLWAQAHGLTLREAVDPGRRNGMPSAARSNVKDHPIAPAGSRCGIGRGATRGPGARV